MNTVQILGNLARDPEVRYTQSGKAVATFTVAASNTYLDSEGQAKEQTAFVNCVAWGKLGESVGNLRKGNRAFVEGRLQTRSYETADGQKRYVTEVVAGFVGTSLMNDDNAPSNFDSFADDKSNDENVPF
nr:MAG TPA: Single strand binding protein [Caudoviricetes sp.]